MHLRKASSCYESLLALNARFKKEGKPEAKLLLVPDALEDEDMMEMLNAGLLELMVMDDWKAQMWAQFLPKVKPLPAVKLREAGKMGWIVTSEKIGAETTTYVRNIYKYYVAYKLIEDTQEAQRRATEQLAPGAK